jgi:hypothetical protein
MSITSDEELPIGSLFITIQFMEGSELNDPGQPVLGVFGATISSLETARAST